MSARNSGYSESWNRNRNRARTQPTPPNISLSPQDMNNQSHQYHFHPQSYRDPCGTSVSAIESVPDYSSQNPLDELHDQDYDQVAFIPTDALAGLDFPSGSPLDINPLTLGSTYNPMSPNTPCYPDVPPFGPDLFLDNGPWNEYRTFPRNEDIMPGQSQSQPQSQSQSQTQSQSYAQPSTAKRRRLNTSNSSYMTQPSLSSSGYNQSHNQMRSRSTHNTDSYTPTSATAQQDEIASSYNRQEQQPRASPVSTSSPGHLSPSQPTSKATKKSTEKYVCNQCEPAKLVSFGTINDLTRHRRGVHGMLEDGDKFWQCDEEGCASAKKMWPRRDNFQSHLKRMHYSGDEIKARESVDNFEQVYKFEIHGNLEQAKLGRGGPQHSKSTQHSSSPNHTNKRAFGPGTSAEQSHLMVNFTDQGPGMFPQYNNGVPSHVSGTFTSQTINQGGQATNPSAGTGRRDTLAVPPRFLKSPRSGGMGRNMGRPAGDARTAPPNPDSWTRQQREMQEQDQAAQNFSPKGPSAEDLTSLVQGVGFEHASTIDPSLIFSAGSRHRQSQSNVTGGGPGLVMDPEKELDEMLKKFSPEQVHALSRILPEFKARFANRSERVDESDQGQSSSERSVPKPSTEKKTDGEKTLKCNAWIQKKGEKEKTVRCSSRFNSPSELRKHRKRHQKRFGCTFDNCFSRFGTKWEWKRHEQNQHIQNEAWRCRYEDGGTRCQKLFSEKELFEHHLTRDHPHEPGTRAMEEEIEACHLFQKWLGSYWCGFCQRVLRSQKATSRDMVDERFEHISTHIEQRSKSADWIELAAEGETKGKMKEIKDSGGRLMSYSEEANTRKRQRDNGVEGEEEGENDDGGDDSDDFEDTDTDESDSPPELQRSRQRSRPRPSVDTLAAQNSPIPSCSRGSHTLASSNTPTIHEYDPNGQRMADHRLDDTTTRHPQRQRAHSDSNPTGYRPQQSHQLQQQQQQSQSLLPPLSQSQSEQHHTPSRSCCVCHQTSWGDYQDKCDFPDCQHQCTPFCGPFTGGFPADGDANFAFFGMGV